MVEIKSKRIPTALREKIHKKAKEHHRKERKLAKKTFSSKGRKQKNPPLPNSLIQLMEKDQQKLEDLLKEAEERNRHFHQKQKQLAKTGTDQKDGSLRAYMKEFKKVIEESDVILEVLDARDPLGSRAKQVEQQILEAGSNQKRLILVLNKIDLIPKENLAAWMQHLQREFPTVAFKASTQSQRSHIGQVSVDPLNAGDLKTSECIGADSLLQLLKNYCRNENIKTTITVGIVGYPNVGKSSLINSLKRSRACVVGSTPGVTKARQLVHLDKNIKLLDCPGIVFSKENDTEVLLRNCVKLEKMDDVVKPVELLIKKFPASQLMSLYSIPQYANVDEFLLFVSKRAGKLRKGGLPDIEATAKMVLEDWNSGKIPYFSVPPSIQKNEISSAEIVSTFSKEFDLSSCPIKVSQEEFSSRRKEESMEVEDAPEATRMRLMAKRPKKTLQENQKKSVFSSAELQNNPQINQLKKKEAKKMKKQGMRRSAATSMEDYSFDDFTPLPGMSDD